ncbi:LINE-1 retrotransposable element ORF2 protein [Smittium culicis]|uniref:LINE-1 retrotransposable element ORF2 protein n=1 Tax=Smittium culicis TaxID=133412 RepID=A0A1R1YP60_9FUNG|nr:LINE-1 retrotransposable element ORF2 protein [Smittium culicis]
MDNIRNIRIGYWNCQGLSSKKWNPATEAIVSGRLDMLFLAETWFVDHEYHSSHPKFFAATTRTQEISKVGHEKGGIICLMSDEIRRMISSAYVTTSTISIKINQYHIKAVYFPPSMKGDTIRSYFTDDVISVFLGDINAFYGATFGTKKIGPKPRIKVIEEICSLKSLNHLMPQPKGPTPDHAFVHTSLSASWHFSNFCDENYNISAMLLKKALKASNSFRIVCSRSDDISALQDSINFYKELYSNDIDSTMLTCQYTPVDHYCYDYGLDKFFSHSNIKKSIDAYPSSKSAGPDPLHINILKALACSNAFISDLHVMFRYMLKYATTPKCWNTSHIYPIPKSKDSMTIDCFRPIALTKMLRRIFESMFLEFLNNTKLANFNPLQAGFRTGFSTLTHSVISHDLFYLKNECKRPDRIFIDLKQAYDRVNINILLFKIKRRSHSDLITSIIQSLFAECYSTVSINGSSSEPFIRQRGLFQGSILSPFLFNLYVDDLVTELDSCKQVPSALFFADDIQLLPKSIEDANMLIKIVERWCKNNGMQINIQKSAYIGTSNWNLIICGQNLPTPNIYKYLGLPITNGGVEWRSFVADLTNRADKMLKLLQVKGNNWSPLTRLTLYKSNVRSIWEYAAPLMALAISPAEYCYLEKVQQNSLAWVMSASEHTGMTYNRLFRSLCGVETIIDRYGHEK